MPFGDFWERVGLMAAWRAQPPVARGAIMMCVSTVAFSLMHVTVRHVSAEIPPIEVAFFRNLFGLAIILPILLRNGFGAMKTKRLGLHALRGVINIVAMFMFFTAIATTPLAKVTALSFTAPIFAAALSVLILGERFRMRRWAAIMVGFLGMLIILRPGLTVVDAGALLAIGAALLWAVAMTIIKILSRTESSMAIVAWMGLFLSAFSLVPAILVWVTPSPAAWFWLVCIGLVGTVAQVSLSQSLKETDPTAVLPFDFLKLIWAALLAAWLFGEIPDLYTWIGAAVIFSSGLYIAHRERRGARKV